MEKSARLNLKASRTQIAAASERAIPKPPANGFPSDAFRAIELRRALHWINEAPAIALSKLSPTHIAFFGTIVQQVQSLN